MSKSRSVQEWQRRLQEEAEQVPGAVPQGLLQAVQELRPEVPEEPAKVEYQPEVLELQPEAEVELRPEQLEAEELELP